MTATTTMSLPRKEATPTKSNNPAVAAAGDIVTQWNFLSENSLRADTIAGVIPIIYHGINNKCFAGQLQDEMHILEILMDYAKNNANLAARYAD